MQLGMITGAIVGALGGFLVGNLMYGEKCVAEVIETTCYPAKDLKVYVVTAVGLVVGLLTGFLVTRLRRSELL